jgi:hypothetical protein
MAESTNPPWFVELTTGLAEIARLNNEAGDAGRAPVADSLAFTRALTARSQFLDAMEQLATAPGATAAEVEQVAAGILGLAAPSNEKGLPAIPNL